MTSKTREFIICLSSLSLGLIFGVGVRPKSTQPTYEYQVTRKIPVNMNERFELAVRTTKEQLGQKLVAGDSFLVTNVTCNKIDVYEPPRGGEIQPVCQVKIVKIVSMQ